jgi:hypothetical protein
VTEFEVFISGGAGATRFLFLHSVFSARNFVAMTLYQAARFISLCLVLVLVSTGCDSSKGTSPKGKIVKGGQPLAVKSKGPIPPGTKHLVVELIGENGTSESVVVGEDNSSFTVVGAEGKGVKPGKYKLAVQFFDPDRPNDQLKGAFNTQNTKLTVTIEAGKDIGTIDLDSPPK